MTERGRGGFSPFLGDCQKNRRNQSLALRVSADNVDIQTGKYLSSHEASSCRVAMKRSLTAKVAGIEPTIFAPILEPCAEKEPYCLTES